MKILAVNVKKFTLYKFVCLSKPLNNVLILVCVFIYQIIDFSFRSAIFISLILDQFLKNTIR